MRIQKRRAALGGAREGYRCAPHGALPPLSRSGSSHPFRRVAPRTPPSVWLLAPLPRRIPQHASLESILAALEAEAAGPSAEDAKWAAATLKLLRNGSPSSLKVGACPRALKRGAQGVLAWAPGAGAGRVHATFPPPETPGDGAASGAWSSPQTRPPLVGRLAFCPRPTHPHALSHGLGVALDAFLYPSLVLMWFLCLPGEPPPPPAQRRRGREPGRGPRARVRRRAALHAPGFRLLRGAPRENCDKNARCVQARGVALTPHGAQTRLILRAPMVCVCVFCQRPLQFTTRLLHAYPLCHRGSELSSLTGATHPHPGCPPPSLKPRQRSSTPSSSHSSPKMH